MRQRFLGVLRRGFGVSFLALLDRGVEMADSFLDMRIGLNILRRLGMMQRRLGMMRDCLRVPVLARLDGFVGVVDGGVQMAQNTA